MKSKTLLLVFCAAIIATSITALCNNGMEALFFEDFTQAEFETAYEPDFRGTVPKEVMPDIVFELEEITPAAFSVESFEKSFDTFSEYISVIDTSKNDKAILKNSLVSTAVNYAMTADELDCIEELVKSGYDIEKVLDIYRFVRRTDCDCTYIADIYHEGIENSDRKNWIYDAYDKIFERTDDMLTVEDVAYYINSGLTVDEIAGAYELSFAGKKSTKQMLKERMQGASWNIISASALSDNSEFLTTLPEMTINDVIRWRTYCVKMRKDVKDIVITQNGKIELSKSAADQIKSMHETQYALEKKLNAEMPEFAPEQKSAMPKADKSEGMLYTQTEAQFEEDLIPVDEVEVE